MSEDRNSGEKDKALNSAISLLEKNYGKGAIMQLGDNIPAHGVDTISTGSLGLDIALGVGGMPRGRICEIYGPESSGKTTLALHLAAETQKAGGTVVFIDAEHALDVTYAKKLGVDISKLLVSQPDYGEQALEICETLVTSGSVDLVIVDSVAALVPRAEIDGEMGDQQMGLQARLMSKAMRKLTATAHRSKCMILFINQIRMKIGVMFGSPETTTGGNALKFYSSVRLDIRRIGSIKDSENVLGNRVRVKVVKNKVAPPFRETEFDVIFNEGVSQTGEIIDMGVDKGIIDKVGSWYSYRGERLGQGRENAKVFLKENPDVAKEIKQLILSSLGIGVQADDSSTGTKAPVELKAVKGKKSKAKSSSKGTTEDESFDDNDEKSAAVGES
ncbi:MAG: recombinase RecA [Bdellovibrionales bacterium]|nr:recombinase RecA [Bdellovibrionales bacterium]